MLHQEVTHVSFDNFKKLSEGSKVILLYPWSNYRNVFLTYFLDNAREGLLYYRIPDYHDRISIWLQGLINELDHVLGGFGSSTRSILSDGTPQQLGEALAADLNAYGKDSTVLYLDELDRVNQDDNFRNFIDSLVRSLGPNVQLAVNSRMLTYQPWIDYVASGEAVVLGTSHRRSNLMFTVESTPRPQLEIYTFGRGYALINGYQIENWDGALPRNLFFYFIDNPLVTRDQIFETFWPKLSVKEATNVFHVTKRKITERISVRVDDPGNFELTKYSAGFYMPSEKLVRHYDVTDFEECVEQALMITDDIEREKLYRKAIEIYKAPFLQTVNMPWVTKRRQELQIAYSEALIGMGRINVRRQRFEDALGFFVRSLKEAPQREDIHREVMTMYMNLGRPEDARDQYRKLEEFLSQTVGIGPSKETRDLMATLSNL